jgi:outer membrane protein OmpA-like peptidoglycan-associated protein
MKKSLSIIIAALAIASVADAQVKLKPDGKLLRRNTISVYGMGGATWVSGLEFKNVDPTTGTSTSPMVGAGIDFNFRPWIRMGANYKFSTYKREHRFDNFVADGQNERSPEVTNGNSQLSRSEGGTAYESQRYLNQAVDLTVEFNFLELWKNRQDRRFNLWLGTGIGWMWNRGTNYRIKMGTNEWTDPTNIQNGVTVKDNYSIESYVKASNLRRKYDSPYVPVVANLEFDIIPQLTIGVRGGVEFMLKRRHDNIERNFFAGMTLRYNIVGKKNGVRSYQPLYAETLDELNKLRGEYEQYKEAQKKPDYLKTIAEELSDIKDILKENGLSKKTVAPDFTVQFAQGSADINETEQVRIEEFVKTLGTDYTISLELLGEASAEGERNANQRLSEVRMAKVKQALIKYGVAPSRISSERAIGADNNGGPAHRRVMITVK